MNNNYCWIFFQKPLMNRDYMGLKQNIEDYIRSHILISLNQIDRYQFSLQNQKINGEWDDDSIIIQRTVGNYLYSLCLIRILFGFDNILLYLNRLDPNEFNNVMESDIPLAQFSELSLKINQFLQNTINLKRDKDYIELKGFHNCMLNCGDCCDCSVHTRSPLLGGQYCKYLTSVGNLCIHRLHTPPHIPHDQVCIDYFCGDLSGPEWDSMDSYPYFKWIGTHHRKFQPIYKQDKLNEFFTILKKIRESEEGEAYLDTIKRSKEIDMYSMTINDFFTCIKGLNLNPGEAAESKNIIDYIVFQVERNEFRKALEFINNQIVLDKNARKALTEILEKLIDWYTIYQKRKEEI